MNDFYILMYHGIHASDEDASYSNNVYCVSESNFRTQLDYLVAHGYTPILLNEINKLEMPEKPVVISFDDGDKSNITHALPILKDFGIRAEFFVTTGRVGNDDNAMTELDIKQLSDAGMSIQSHGVTHKYLSDLSLDELHNELFDSKVFLENITLKEVQYLSLPGGRGSVNVINAAKKLEYKAICTSEFGVNNNIHELYSLRRITIYRNTTISELAKMLDKNSVYYRYLLIRKKFLDFVKKLIGNRIYSFVHQFLYK